MRNFINEMLLGFRGKQLLAMLAIYSVFQALSVSFSQTGTISDTKDDGKALVRAMLHRAPTENSRNPGIIEGSAQ